VVVARGFQSPKGSWIPAIRPRSGDRRVLTIPRVRLGRRSYRARFCSVDAARSMVGLALEFHPRIWNCRFWCAVGDADDGPGLVDIGLEITRMLEPQTEPLVATHGVWVVPVAPRHDRIRRNHEDMISSECLTSGASFSRMRR
jgi:hypothetical protein